MKFPKEENSSSITTTNIYICKKIFFLVSLKNLTAITTNSGVLMIIHRFDNSLGQLAQEHIILMIKVSLEWKDTN